jgi:hypothetical protein
MNITESSLALFNAISCLKPFDIDKQKVRRGPLLDGGYIFAEGLRPSQPLLSFGVGSDCDLEYEFAERGHRVVMFDPTVEGPPRTHENFMFHKIGISGANSADGKWLSVRNAIRHAGFEGRKDVILKMDIEGAELMSLAAASPDTLLHFEQIVVELHWLNKLIEPEYYVAFMGAMKNIISNFKIFHVHANNCSPMEIIGGARIPHLHPIGGFSMPFVMEISCLRADMAAFFESRTLYPTHLDYPNHPQRPDHLLAFYPFLPGSSDMAEAIAAMAQLNDIRYEKALRE